MCIRDSNISRLSLEEIFCKSDIISIHLPLDNETNGLINKELIHKMKKNSIFINTSRSSVVDNFAVADSIKSKKILGAAIDVFNEDKNIHPYEEIENVILTPHIGSHTLETRKEMEKSAVSNLLNYHCLITKTYSGEIEKLIFEIDRNTVI